MTTKGLRYIQIRENAVQESVLSNFVVIKHIEGKITLADIFTKEDKDCAHFISIRDMLVQDVPKHIMTDQGTSSIRGGCQPKILVWLGDEPLRSLPSSHNIYLVNPLS